MYVCLGFVLDWFDGSGTGSVSEGRSKERSSQVSHRRRWMVGEGVVLTISGRVGRCWVSVSHCQPFPATEYRRRRPLEASVD